jgi:hypothetical protein
VVTAFGFGAVFETIAVKSRAFMFVFLTLALPRLFYFAEYEVLTAVPNYWAHS